MKKINIVFSALAAIAGIGGAYSSAISHLHATNIAMYNWYTAGGLFQFTTTAEAAATRCPVPGPSICLIGTSPGQFPIRMYRPN